MAKIEILNTANNNDCILCGDKVATLKEPVKTRCDFCGEVKLTNHECESSHFLCDECFNIPVTEYIKSTCLKYKGDDPIELAVEIMNAPVIKMHGPEHHFIVPAVLLTCINNARKQTDNLIDLLNIADERAVKESSDTCTFHSGVCGAAIGTGIFLSMFLGRNHEQDDAWSLTNHVIADTTKKIAEHGGPKCCKRDTYFALLTVIDYLNDGFALNLKKSDAKCTFSLRNRSCGLEECIFYNMSNSLV
ncbi:MAG: DUF5714 domain-containing protein [Candidatus Kapaibacterium sp.]